MDKQQVDILVVGGGWIIDAGHQPQLTNNRWSIGQDIKHAIMESGLARELQGERSVAYRCDVMTRIELLTEQDNRIKAGTARCIEETQRRYLLTAETKDFGVINARMQF